MDRKEEHSNPKGTNLGVATLLEEEITHSNKDLIFQLVVAEFTSLKDEVSVRIASQAQISNIAVTLVAGVVAGFPLIVFSDPSSQKLRYPISFVEVGLLLLSSLFMSLQWSFMQHSIQVAQIESYIQNVLRPRLIKLLSLNENSSPIFLWERFKTNLQYPRITSLKSLSLYSNTAILGLSRQAIMIIPALLLLVFAGILLVNNLIGSEYTNIDVFATILAIITAIYFLATIAFMSYVGTAYKGIPRE